MLNIQTTKLPQVDKIIPFCKVISLASGSVPKYIIVELPNSDGARINAWWTGSPSNLAVNDYVRIQRQAIDKRYVVIGTDQSTADVVTGGAIPAPGKVKVWDVSAGTAVDYNTLPDALAVYENNDIIVLGAGDYDIDSAQIANSNVLSIIGQGRTLTTITSSHATEIFKPTADLTVEGLTINATGGGDAFTIDDTTVIIRDVTYEIAFGPSIVGLNIGASAEALVTVEYSRFVVGGGTAIAIANNSSNLYIYAGYFGGAAAISHTNTPNIELYDTPTLVGTVSSLVEGVYIDASGDVILGPDAFVEFDERASAPSTPATGRWRMYFKSDGAYQVDDGGAETSLAQSGGGSAINNVANGRLSLANSASNSLDLSLEWSSSSQIFLYPWGGNQISLYDGSADWDTLEFTAPVIGLQDTQSGTRTSGSAIITGLTDTSQWIVGMEVSGTGIPGSTTISSIDSATQITMSANATSSGTANVTVKIPASKNVDIFAFNNSGSVKLEFGPLWTNDTTRATGLTTQDGIYVKSGATTRKWLGTVRTIATAGLSEDTSGRSAGNPKRFLWNYYNRTMREMYLEDWTGHTYSTAAWRSWDTDDTNRIELVAGEIITMQLSIRARGAAGAAGQSAATGIGENVTNNSSTRHTVNNLGTHTQDGGVSLPHVTPTIGYNFYQAVEFGGAAGSSIALLAMGAYFEC